MSETPAGSVAEAATTAPPEPIPVTLDAQQLAQLAEAVTTGLAEYLTPVPVAVTPSGVTETVSDPGPETPDPASPQDPPDSPQDPPETTEPPTEIPLPSPPADPTPPVEE
ncbi:hypothetical protein ACFRI7_04230 [Streptomyces sp. NPDC056716]|uniref:hypothetical protein n=1 Tax=unclassified Streptomyces TaxID=2593676 RepID=UPI0036C9F9D0